MKHGIHHPSTFYSIQSPWPIVQISSFRNQVQLQFYSCSRPCRGLAAHLCLTLGQVVAQTIGSPGSAGSWRRVSGVPLSFLCSIFWRLNGVSLESLWNLPLICLPVLVAWTGQGLCSSWHSPHQRTAGQGNSLRRDFTTILEVFRTEIVWLSTGYRGLRISVDNKTWRKSDK